MPLTSVCSTAAGRAYPRLYETYGLRECLVCATVSVSLPRFRPPYRRLFDAVTRIWKVASSSLHLTGRPVCERAWALTRWLLLNVGAPRTYIHASVSAEGRDTYVWTCLESPQRVPVPPTSLLRNRRTSRHRPNGHSHFPVGNGRRETRLTHTLPGLKSRGTQEGQDPWPEAGASRAQHRG